MTHKHPNKQLHAKISTIVAILGLYQNASFIAAVEEQNTEVLLRVSNNLNTYTNMFVGNEATELLLIELLEYNANYLSELVSMFKTYDMKVIAPTEVAVIGLLVDCIASYNTSGGFSSLTSDQSQRITSAMEILDAALETAINTGTFTQNTNLILKDIAKYMVYTLDSKLSEGLQYKPLE